MHMLMVISKETLLKSPPLDRLTVPLFMFDSREIFRLSDTGKHVAAEADERVASTADDTIPSNRRNFCSRMMLLHRFLSGRRFRPEVCAIQFFGRRRVPRERSG
jgi:hypothetical protein